MSELDLTSFRNAIAQADEALELAGSDLARPDARFARHLRAAAIQAFEFTYELAVKTLRRFLETVEADPATVDRLSFNDLVRRGYVTGVLAAELAQWKDFRRDRGITSHAYDEAKAQVVFEGIPAFLTEARFLAGSVAERQAEG